MPEVSNDIILLNPAAGQKMKKKAFPMFGQEFMKKLLCLNKVQLLGVTKGKGKFC